MLSPADIAALRKSLGLSLEGFGSLVGVSKQCVQQWETGVSHPRYRKMQRLNEIRADPEQFLKPALQ